MIVVRWESCKSKWNFFSVIFVLSRSLLMTLHRLLCRGLWRLSFFSYRFFLQLRSFDFKVRRSSTWLFGRTASKETAKETFLWLFIFLLFLNILLFSKLMLFVSILRKWHLSEFMFGHLWSLWYCGSQSTLLLTSTLRNGILLRVVSLILILLKSCLLLLKLSLLLTSLIVTSTLILRLTLSSLNVAILKLLCHAHVSYFLISHGLLVHIRLHSCHLSDHGCLVVFWVRFFLVLLKRGWVFVSSIRICHLETHLE